MQQQRRGDRGAARDCHGVDDPTQTDIDQQHRRDRHSGSSHGNQGSGSGEPHTRGTVAARAQLLALTARRHVIGPHLQDLRHKQDQNGTP
jgi:hypothetical protein